MVWAFFSGGLGGGAGGAGQGGWCGAGGQRSAAARDDMDSRGRHWRPAVVGGSEPTRAEDQWRRAGA